LSIIIIKLLKDFWPYIATGLVFAVMAGVIWYRGSRIESLENDIIMQKNDLELSKSALKREKTAFQTLNQEYFNCTESLQEKEEDVKNLYKICEQQKLDLSKFAENMESEWKKWKDWKSEKIEGCPDFEDYKRQINDVTRELLK
jgi:hypothetical protein